VRILEPYPWRYIAVEGVIGVGKTSLSRLLAEALAARLNLEPVEENPFLQRFYENRQANAFVTQMFFLLSRYRQQISLAQGDLFSGRLVSDYLFAKDRIFANLNLDDDELRLYEHMATLLETKIPKPDLVIYLQASSDLLMERIRARGRSFEKPIEPAYIQALNEAYNYFFFHYEETPLLVVNCNEIDFVRNNMHFEDLLSRCKSAFTGTQYYVPPSAEGA
jgi:deoxyadenosine/deoxycytidine kinase